MLKVNDSINQTFTKAPAALLGPGLQGSGGEIWGCEGKPSGLHKNSPGAGGEQHCSRITMTSWGLFSSKLGVRQIREEALKNQILQCEIMLFIMTLVSLLVRPRCKTPHQGRGLGTPTRTWTYLNPLNFPYHWWTKTGPITLTDGLLHCNNQVLFLDVWVVVSFPSAIYSYPFFFFLSPVDFLMWYFYTFIMLHFCG